MIKVRQRGFSRMNLTLAQCQFSWTVSMQCDFRTSVPQMNTRIWNRWERSHAEIPHSHLLVTIHIRNLEAFHSHIGPLQSISDCEQSIFFFLIFTVTPFSLSFRRSVVLRLYIFPILTPYLLPLWCPYSLFLSSSFIMFLFPSSCLPPTFYFQHLSFIIIKLIFLIIKYKN